MRATLANTLFELAKQPFEVEILTKGSRLLFGRVFRLLYII
jgi:hypothetical protein